MKRIFVIALVLCLLPCALADYVGNMMVVNCQEFVSLRESPDRSSERLAKVPLNAVVGSAETDPSFGDFTFCDYEGQGGYILSEYLVPTDQVPETTVLDVTVQGHHLVAKRSYPEEGERLRITCDEGLWTYEVTVQDPTELTMTAAFIGGTAEDPMVMVYSTTKSLQALNLQDGTVRWTFDACDLGAGTTAAVDADGRIYIGGYYGPDPVCIDVDGNLVWQSDSEGCYWLYDIQVESDRIVCTYDMMPDGESGTVSFDMSGNKIS